jgi:hypothetical protein
MAPEQVAADAMVARWRRSAAQLRCAVDNRKLGGGLGHQFDCIADADLAFAKSAWSWTVPAGPSRREIAAGSDARLEGARTAATAITGIDELLRRIHKDQFDLGELRLKNGVRPLSGRRSARTLTEPLN